MSRFRTVHAARAGEKAVGILLPPGNRTVIVLRPRALPIDLVMVRRQDDGQPAEGFFEAGRQLAGIEAQKLSEMLNQGAEVRMEVRQSGGTFQVHVEIETVPLIACPRIPGQPYRPMQYRTREEAGETAGALRGYLCPGPDANQELYTNLSQFARINDVSPG